VARLGRAARDLEVLPLVACLSAFAYYLVAFCQILQLASREGPGGYWGRATTSRARSMHGSEGACGVQDGLASGGQPKHRPGPRKRF
jgi:hypothetical protein